MYWVNEFDQKYTEKCLVDSASRVYKICYTYYTAQLLFLLMIKFAFLLKKISGNKSN